jgi:16S rRNA processing protein RimM
LRSYKKQASIERVQGQRGSADSSAEPRFLVIGRIVKPHGIYGEVRVEIHTDLPERFTWLEKVYLGKDEPYPIAVENVRFHKGWALLKLDGYDSREDAEELRSIWLQVPYDEGVPLEEGEYYLYEAVGLAVYTDDGDYLGEVTDILETGANNVFTIHGSQGEILLPDTAEVIREIDFDARRVLVHLLPGLIQ